MRQDEQDQRGEQDGQHFGGIIGRDWRDSTPWWPAEAAPPAGAPNVVLVVLDDVGFAQLGCYGSDIETPVLDGLASGGIRLANFHTTALCSPTRACLLTGRNHHRSGMGRVADLAIGYPGYWGKPPRQHGYLSEILRAAGYATYAVGKWHLSPEDETNMAASRATWPLARGFDRWYGFHGGETHQFAPALYHDNHSVRPPASIGNGYHLTEDLAGRAIEFLGDLRAVDAARPFFLYFATGACHSPHQPPARWRDHYRGRFDQGWDSWREKAFGRQLADGVVPAGTVLSPRPGWVPAWDSLAAADRQVAARFMECFAGFLSHADEQIGRVLGFLDELGERDNTIVVVVSDNGASAEGGAEGSINDIRLLNLDPASSAEMLDRIDEIGGPDTHNNYPWGWTMAGNTPFRRWKREVHEGGVADPCIISWPGGGLAPARSGTSSRTPSTSLRPFSSWPGWWCPSRSTASRRPAWTAPASATCCHRAARRSQAGTRPSTSRCSAPGPSTTAAGRPSRFTRSARSTTTRTRTRRSTRTPGSCTTSSRICPSRVTWPPQQPALLAELIEPVVAGGARATRCCRSTTGCCGRWSTPSRTAALPRTVYRYFPGGAQVPESVAVNVRNRSHALIADVRHSRRGERRRRAAGPRFGAGRLVAAHPAWQAPLRAQPVRQGTARRRVSRASRPRPASCRAGLHQGRRPWRRRGAVLRRNRARDSADTAVHTVRLQRRRRRA